MFAGFDFGTSNSALGIYQDNRVKLMPLYNDETFLPSTLYTFERSFICDYLMRNLSGSAKQVIKEERLAQLQRAAGIRRYESLTTDQTMTFFGKQAIDNYIATPEEGVFIKSPKSFLGATGLSSTQLNFFEDLVSAMMLNIKLIAESKIHQQIDRVVIGRPVNFQGVDSNKSNIQAIDIMTRAAKRCGYKAVEFLYEPLAAGVDFETGLKVDKVVLVVDIGGGTTDCSVVKMGPSYINKEDRTKDFLAHTGQRIGGNDLDIFHAYKSLMPLFGLGSQQKQGIEFPHAPFWSAVSVNNVAEQANFTSAEYLRKLKYLKRDARQPELIERLIFLRNFKLNHRLIRTAELSKIALSDCQESTLTLDYIEAELKQQVDRVIFEEAVERPLMQIQKLIQEVVKLAQVKPELVYITGGTAKSPTIRKLIREVIPNVDILDGDYYGSVANGLTKWARKIWGV